MNVRKDIYNLLVSQAEKLANEAVRKLRHNQQTIKQLAKEQTELKQKKSEAYRIVQELKKKVAVSTKKG